LPFMKLELLIEDISSKALRPFLRNAQQKTKISQGFFRSLAEELNSEGFPIAHVEKKEQIQSSVNDCTKLFLIGCSDEAFGENDHYLLEGRSAFVQNLTGRMSERVRPLPIGIEDLSYARNGMPWNFRRSFVKENKLDKVLVGPFRPTSPSRARLLTLTTKYENCVVVHGRMPSARYARLAAEYRYVACPEGNGMDTHRFWETLYRGSIPIVIDSPFVRNWQDLGVPMVVLDDWSDIEQTTWRAHPAQVEANLHWTLDTRAWKSHLRALLLNLTED